ncbi:MAG TPA: ATP-binding protein [Gaiellaceae bacterium]
MLQLRLQACPESASMLRECLCSWLETAGAAKKDVFEVSLAATEAFANAVLHPRNANTPVVDVTACMTDHSVRLSIRDYGTWQDGSTPNRNGGYGLPMMRLLMDGVDVQADRDGTTVTLWRALTLH